MCIYSEQTLPQKSNCTNTQQTYCSKKSFFPLFFEDMPRMENGEMKITSVQKKVQARVSEVNLDHGFVEHFVEKEALLKTITKNGARTVPENNGKILFHKSEVSGPMSNLKTGDMVEFNLVHVKTNNRIIAQRVYKPSPAEYEQDEVAKQLAHFQRFEMPRTFKAPEQPKIVYVKDCVIGTLCEIEMRSNGTGHAFLKTKAVPDNKVLLHFNQLIDTDTSVMKVGDAFKFKLFKNNHNGCYIARNCQYLQPGQLISNSNSAAQSVETIGHFQFMEAPKLTSSIDMPKFTPILKNATGTIHSTVMAQRCGFITIDAHLANRSVTTDTKIFFHENNMIGQILSEMIASDRVMFTLEKNNQNGKYVAKAVEATTLAQPANGAASNQLQSGLALHKSIWEASSFDLPTSSTNKTPNNLKPYNKNVSLLNDSEKRRMSVETLNKISNSAAKNSYR